MTTEQRLQAITDAYLTWVGGKSPDSLTPFELAIRDALGAGRAS